MLFSPIANCGTRYALKIQKQKLEEKVVERTIKISKQNNLLIKQSDDLNDANTVLEERQQQIEEQAEELNAQKEELEHTNDKLYDLNAMKDKFFAIIGHDLINPIGTIIGMSELLTLRFESLTNEKRIF